MPLAQLKGLSGYLSMEQKQELIRKVTDAIVSVEGEGLRPVTWVIVEDVPLNEPEEYRFPQALWRSQCSRPHSRQTSAAIRTPLYRAVRDQRAPGLRARHPGRLEGVPQTSEYPPVKTRKDRQSTPRRLEFRQARELLRSSPRVRSCARRSGSDERIRQGGRNQPADRVGRRRSPRGARTL